MSKYVVRYKKTGDGKYVSHLDFLRTFQRAMRRAEIPLKYSSGFNPHPLLSFALPLAVGIEGECEMLETELLHDISEDEFRDRVNASLPNVIRVINIEKIEGKNNFSEVSGAVYEVLPENMPTLEEMERFLAHDSIFMEKRTKKGVSSVDIKPDIFKIELLEKHILMTLAAGSVRNLKPTLVSDAMNTYINGFSTGFCRYRRIAILDKNGAKM